MLFACLSHFAWWLDVAYPRLSEWMAMIGMVATPAFVMLSGAMVALRVERAQGVPRRLRAELLDRGLFLLTGAHFLIGVAEVHRNGDLGHRMLQLNTVDTIGVGCIIVATTGTNLLRRPRHIIAAGSSLLLAGWLFAAVWRPHTVLGNVLVEVVFGRTGQHLIGYDCPLAQFLSLYFIGAVIGRAIEDHARVSRLPMLAGRLQSIGAVLIATAIGLRLAWVPLSHHFGSDSVLHQTLTLVKQPPSPDYLLFFGGAALILIGAPMRMARNRYWLPLLEWFAVLGGSSLFVFVAQYFVIWTLPDLLGIRPNVFAPAVFAAEVLLLWALARAWTAMGGNRWLVIGLADYNPAC
jgi:hypothetical protein